MSAPSPGERAGQITVVFLDDGRWAAFYQLAAKLRRHGVRTVRVTSLTQARSRVAARLVFHRCVFLPAGHEEKVLRAVLRSESVTDVQFTETHGALLAACLDELSAELAASVARRIELTDKIAAADLMDLAGVAAPERILLSDPDAAGFIERHGLPLIIKGRVGYGGKDVSVAEDSDELHHAIAAHQAHAGNAYVERFITGEKVNYGAVVSHGEVIQEVCYATSQLEQPHGPSSYIETMEDVTLRDLGRRLVLRSGCPGLMNINFLRDAQGRSWAVDFNVRTFGGVMNFLEAGVDFGEGYLHSIGAASAALLSVPRTHVRIAVFPTSLSAVNREGHVAAAARAFLTQSSPYWRWLGWRYVLSEAIAMSDALRLGRRRLRQARLSSQ